MAWTAALAREVLIALTAATAATSNIDPVHRFAWSENVGWTNWHHDTPHPDDGVLVGESFLRGFVWAENIGWINLGDGFPTDGVHYANTDDTNFGVNLDPESGDLCGLAWGENVGWINFDTSGVAPDQARLDREALRFRGFAWAENVGWINLDDIEHFIGVTALPSIPAVTEWGMVVMTLFALTAGTLVFSQRRSSPTS